jgi:hypothetical protein
MKIPLLLLITIVTANAMEAEFLHQPSRTKVIAPRTFVRMTGMWNGLWLQSPSKDMDSAVFDEKKSFVIRPSGLKSLLTFKKSERKHPGQMWYCQFKDGIRLVNMEQGVFQYHLHFTVNGKPYHFVHKLKYTTRGKGDSISRWSQKESG